MVTIATRPEPHRHCPLFLLEVNPPDARLRDLSSLNGTYVNGVKHGGRDPDESPEAAQERAVPEVDLKHGDRIDAGNTTIQVTVQQPLTCRQCGTEIPDSDRQHADWMPGVVMCRACRASAPTGQPVRPPPDAQVPRCDRCGKDVSVEIGTRSGTAWTAPTTSSSNSSVPR